MIQAYSKRLLSPFTGQVQIVETDTARALTLTGHSWGLQYKIIANPEQARQLEQEGRSVRYDFIRVANITPSGLQRLRLPLHLDPAAVEEQIQLLAEHVSDIELPLPAADFHEYWLLDEADESPLALIYSCIRAEEMPLYPHKPEWTALSSAMMRVEQTEDEQRIYTPPVNYQVEQLVKDRAGQHPKARWIKRREGLRESFPACLLREDWDKEEDQILCRRYIERLSPRLLMLHGLDHDDRLRLETYAHRHALEVDLYYHLYPEIADEKQMSAIRVEAQLRRAAGEKDSF